MKKSATEIIDQYTDNGTLQHGQSQFLGSVTPLKLSNNFFTKAEGSITLDNPSQIKVLGVLDGIITIHADNIEDDGKIFEPILFVAEIGSDTRELQPTKTGKTFKEVTISDSSINPNDKIDNVIVVYEIKDEQVLQIIQFSTRKQEAYPFTEITSSEGSIEPIGGGVETLNFYEETLPLTLEVVDPEGLLGWAMLNPATGEPSDQYITTEQQLIMTQEIWGQLHENYDQLFAVFDKKIE